ncbi:MAG: hypothetical protein IH596_12835 [Bacteroidales bacterium]|nr:hypothetical protein [Bacteroidales bacterium]
MKELIIIFFSSWKFAATFPVAVYAMGMSFTETLVYTNIGGILGVLVSVYLSRFLIHIWKTYGPEKLKFRRKSRRIFTRRNRRWVKIKSNYGLIGIVLLSPVILSIPVGSFLTVRYYGNRIRNILFLIAGQMFWSVVYTLFYTQVEMMIT